MIQVLFNLTWNTNRGAVQYSCLPNCR